MIIIMNTGKAGFVVVMIVLICAGVFFCVTSTSHDRPFEIGGAVLDGAQGTANNVAILIQQLDLFMWTFVVLIIMLGVFFCWNVLAND